MNVLKGAPILSNAVQLDQKRNKLYVPLQAERLYIFSKGVIESEINVGDGAAIRASALNEEDGTFYITKQYSGINQLLVIRNNVIENAIDYRKAIPYSGGYLNPKSMIVDSVNNLAYLAVSHSDDNANTVGFVVVIDLDSYEMTSFEIGQYAKKMGVNRKNGTVYVNYTPHERGEYNIAIFRAGKLLRQQQLLNDFYFFTDVIVDQNTNEVYLVCEPDWKVYYLQDENDSLVLKSVVSVEKWPAKVAYDETRRYLYTANYNENTVSVIHEGKLLATVEVGWEPYGIGVHPETGVVYVSDTRDLAITILTPLGK